jgi:hypothetical protein
VGARRFQLDGTIEQHRHQTTFRIRLGNVRRPVAHTAARSAGLVPPGMDAGPSQPSRQPHSQDCRSKPAEPSGSVAYRALGGDASARPEGSGGDHVPGQAGRAGDASARPVASGGDHVPGQAGRAGRDAPSGQACRAGRATAGCRWSDRQSDGRVPLARQAAVGRSSESGGQGRERADVTIGPTRRRPRGPTIPPSAAAGVPRRKED